MGVRGQMNKLAENSERMETGIHGKLNQLTAMLSAKGNKRVRRGGRNDEGPSGLSGNEPDEEVEDAEERTPGPRLPTRDEGRANPPWARDSAPADRLEEEREEREERQELARADAARAAEERRAAGAGRNNAPTPEEVFGYMPTPVRRGMAKVTEAVVDSAIHNRFARWTACNGHAKTNALSRAVEADTHQGFTRWFEALGKCKSLRQWQAKALALSVPHEGIQATRTVMDVGRLLYVKFAAVSEGVDEYVSADLKGSEIDCGGAAKAWGSA